MQTTGLTVVYACALDYTPFDIVNTGAAYIDQSISAGEVLFSGKSS